MPVRRSRRLCVVLIAIMLDVVSGVASFASAAVPALHVGFASTATIVATGSGSVTLDVRLDDDLRAPLSIGTAVRASIESGDARFVSGSGSADGTVGEAGHISFLLAPGTKAGPLLLRFDAAGTSTELTLALVAAARPPLVVGFATAGIGAVPGSIEASDGAPNGTTARRGTVSLYGSGEVARDTRATVAYNSADTLDQRTTAGPYIDDPNARPFPTYGDSSVRYDDALSLDRAYALIENGRSSATYGEFYAHAAPATAVGGYNVLVSGGQLNLATKSAGVSLFAAKNGIAYGRSVISPTGLAIASQALQPDIVVGSDVLNLIHLDRRSGAVVSQQLLVRGSDYVLDYASGLLRFTNIILPYDENFNPLVVVVQYEYGGATARSTLRGASATANLSRSAHADAWYLDDSAGSADLNVAGQSLRGETPNSAYSISHERSNGFLPLTTEQYGSGGDAYRASFATHGERVRVAVDFSQASAGYDNPYGNYTASGLQTLGIVTSYALSRISTLEFSERFARNHLPANGITQTVDNSDSEAALTLHVAPSSRLSYHVGIAADNAASNGVVGPLALPFGPAQTPSSPAQPSFGGSSFPSPVAYAAGSGHSVNALYGASWQFSPRASLDISRSSPLGGASLDPYDPPQTQAELDVAVGNGGKAFLRQLWQRTSIQALAATQATQTYAATASSSTSVGFEQKVGHLTFESGYAVDHTANGTDLYDAFGVRSPILAAKNLRADGFMQVGQSLYSTRAAAGAVAASPYFIVVGSSLDYARNDFHATGQAQVRTGFDSGSTVQLGVAGPLTPEIALFGSATAAYTTGVTNSEIRAGASYRALRNDRYVSLFSLDSLKSNLTNYDAYVTNVAQVQELYRASSRTEFAGSLAYKIVGDAYFAPRTSIYGLRVDQRIGSRFDLASEYHVSDVAPLAGMRATGFVVETGYRVGGTLRLAAGYNVSGFADPATAVSPTHRGPYLTVSSYIDRIFGWGQAHK